MKILYDGQIYSIQAAGGINRYFANIISRLPSDCRPYLIVPQKPDLNFPANSNLRVLAYDHFRLERISWKLNRLSNGLGRRFINRMSTSKRFDVAHPTYYSLLTRREIRDYRCPVVLTVYDMIHELFPRQTVNSASEIESKRRAVADAQAIICISENTKKDLVNVYAVPERKITVVHLASEIDETLAHGNERLPAKPYYLYVGSRTEYKNFDTLLQAFAKAFPSPTDALLCVVGARFSERESQTITRLGLTNRIEHYGYASDAQLAKLYRCSIAFVYPSLYEGFGLPLVEAMACGAPVIAANSSSIPEVVGDASLLFDPRAVDELADALSSVAGNPEYRASLIKKGRERAKMFSWEITLRKTLEVYRTVL